MNEENGIVKMSPSLETLYGNDLHERIHWLISLRWLAGVAMLLVLPTARFLFQADFSMPPLIAGVLLLGLYNLACRQVYGNLQSPRSGPEGLKRIHRFANIQIALDLALLAVFLHLAGGLENPFLSYFIFHMVIAGILLTPRDAYFQATWAVLLVACFSLSEISGLLPHHKLTGFYPHTAEWITLKSSVGILLIFASTLYLTVYMTTSITRKLRRRENELTEANRMLSRQDQLKSQYVLTVSHDLRSSLATVQSCLAVVLNGLSGAIPEKAREMVLRAEQRTTYLIRFVRDLLNLSRIRSEDRLETVPVSVSALFEKSVEAFDLNIREKSLDVTYQCEDKLMIEANPEAMAELFGNLIENSIKYTPAHGEIRMQAKTAPDGDWIMLTFSDSGIGIPEEAARQIFNDFYRAENAKVMDKNGTGLGLAIVRHIAEAHGGEIWMESRVGRGTTFHVKLPARQKQEDTYEPAKESIDHRG